MPMFVQFQFLTVGLWTLTAMDFCSSVSESLSLFQLPWLYFFVGLICFLFLLLLIDWFGDVVRWV